MPHLKGPVPQAQAKEGPMPQLVKKRRSGWAVLAAGAMVASILAVGASPAAAASRQPDQPATWKACLAPASASYGFTDVAMDSVHAAYINCLAYYGISKGTSADTFDPHGNVTRSQMALFLARAAAAAGIDLGESMDQGFTDIGDMDTERANAINSLVSAGIMFGDTVTSFDPPSTTHFAPSDHVTRWEMAMFLFAFLDHALDTVLVDSLPTSIDGDGTGHVELNSADGETGTKPDDYFRDARRQTPAHVDDRISAIYELGVTNGTNGMVGEQGTFEPNGLVTRAQMATFIMRAMGHTNLRPAGLTAQSTSDDTMVSVRSADFKPIGDARTEVFTTNFPDDAFDPSGDCITRFTANQNPSFNECRLDVGDILTDADTGNALWEGVGIKQGNRLAIACTASGSVHGTYTFMAGTRGSATDFTVYAWMGDIGDAADEEGLTKSVAANTLVTTSDAVKAVITGGTALHVKMGSVVTYTVQLRDAKGNNVGPTPGENNYFNVQVDTYQETDTADTFAADDFTRVRSVREPDSSGQFTIPVGYRDPVRHLNSPDAQIEITVSSASGNDLYLVDMTMPAGDAPADRRTGRDGTTAATGSDVFSVNTERVRFSDNASVATSIKASAANWRLRAPLNRNSITVSVADQYGATFRGGTHQVAATDAGNAGDFPTANAANEYLISASGRRSIGYTHTGTAAQQQAIELALQTRRVTGDTPAEPEAVTGATATVNVYWADLGRDNQSRIATNTDGAYPIILGDPASNQILIDSDDAAGTPFEPHAYGYGSDDKFVVEGEVVTMDQFEEILAGFGDAPKLIADLGLLSWGGYDYNRPNDGATWTISGLSCRAPAAGGD